MNQFVKSKVSEGALVPKGKKYHQQKHHHYLTPSPSTTIGAAQALSKPPKMSSVS